MDITEIKRSEWAQFCKQFNTANQFRQSTLSFTVRRDQQSFMAPFLGITLSKKGRQVDGINIFAGQFHGDQIGNPLLKITEPTSIQIEKDAEGRDVCLSLRSRNGQIARLELNGDKNPELQSIMVRQMAYSLFERRGYSHGDDWSDWFEAERLLRQLEEQLV